MTRLVKLKVTCDIKDQFFFFRIGVHHKGYFFKGKKILKSAQVIAKIFILK